MNKTFEVFENHINTSANGYQEGEDAMSVCGPLTKGKEPLDIYILAHKYAPEGNIIEVGSWLGLSTVTLALALKDRYGFPKYKLYAIDPHDEQHSRTSDGSDSWFDGAPPDFDWHEVFLSNIKKWDVEDYVEVCREYSHDIDLSNIDNVTMVLLDGDHRSEPVYQDLNKFVKKVDKEGLVVMHDHDLGDVQEALKKFKKENPHVLGSMHLANTTVENYSKEWNPAPNRLLGIYKKQIDF